MQKIQGSSNFLYFVFNIFFFKPQVNESADWDPVDKTGLVYMNAVLSRLTVVEKGEAKEGI
jgi:hypothetical protein